MPKINNCRFWPKWQATALSPQLGKKVSPDLITKLVRVNSLLWSALNIYDDFLDGAGERAQLPSANGQIREAYRILFSLNLAPDFYNLLHQSMADMEKINGREIKRQKIVIKDGALIIPRQLTPAPNYHTLAKKSLPLALGPMAVWAAVGQKMNSEAIKRQMNFWRYALAAKQLSDDAKDWREDLNKGEITIATRLILDSARKKHLKIYLDNRDRTLDLLFVQAAAGPLAKKINYYCRQARKQLSDKWGIKDNSLMTGLILPLENAAREAERFRRLIID